MDPSVAWRVGSVDNFNSGGRPLFELAIVLTTAACALVGCRLTLRLMRFQSLNAKDKLGMDDVCIVAALGCAISMGIMTILSVYYGYGNPMKEIQTDALHNAFRMFWGTQIVYKAVMMFTKLSLLCMYLRVFVTRRWFIITCYIVGGFVVLYAVGSIIATIVQCTPIRKAWNKPIEGHCINMTAFWYANAIASITTDLTIILLPMYPVWKLQIPKRSKILLAGVFLVGGIVILASILRMTTLKVGSKAADQSSGTLNSTCWTTVEANVGIIGACLPILRNAIVSCFPRLLASRNRSGNGESENAGRASVRQSLALRGLRSHSNRNYRDIENGRPIASAGSDQAMLNGGSRGHPWGGISKKTELDIVIHDADSGSQESQPRGLGI